VRIEEIRKPGGEGGGGSLQATITAFPWEHLKDRSGEVVSKEGEEFTDKGRKVDKKIGRKLIFKRRAQSRKKEGGDSGVAYAERVVPKKFQSKPLQTKKRSREKEHS